MADETPIPAPVPADSPVPPKSLRRRLWNFGKALRADSDFYIHTQAVKGGAGAVIMGGVGASLLFFMQLPFIVAAAGIAACVGLAAVGVIGIALAGKTLWRGLTEGWSKHMSGQPVKPRKPAKSLYRKMLEHPQGRRFLHQPLVKKLLHSRIARTTRVITKVPQDLFLNSLAIEGSVFFGVLSAAALVTTILIFPVVALSSLLTVGTLVAVGVVAGTSIGLANSLRGTYLGTRNLIRFFRGKKAAAPAAMAAVPIPPTLSSKPAKAPLSSRFTQWAAKKAKALNPGRHIPKLPHLRA